MNRSWTEIKLDVIQNNYRLYESEILARFGDSPCEVMAVVKADAYGYGDTQVAAALQKIGCKNFAVSNLNEAINLRKANITGQILILGYTPPEEAHDLLKYDITQALLCDEYAQELAGVGIKAHFAIDSGMNRIGLDANKPEKCEAIIRKFARQFKLTGIFTHLCVADTPSEAEFTNEQLAKFKAVAQRVSDLNLPYVHCMNSAGGLWQEPFGNLTRLGIILYGLKPDYANSLPSGIKPALEWKSVISMIKTVQQGETIGYGRSFRAEQKLRVATIPTGYADGYNRMLSNKGCVLICGKRARILGRVCMDQFMVDVTDIPQAKAGREVTLLGEGYDADEMAHCIGTIGYEIVCNISSRVERRYMPSALFSSEEKL